MDLLLKQSLDDLAAAFRQVVSAGNSGRVVMQPLSPTGFSMYQNGDVLGMKMSSPTVLNPRDLVVVAGALTVRASRAYAGTAGGAAAGTATADTVVNVSGSIGVNPNGTLLRTGGLVGVNDLTSPTRSGWYMIGGSSYSFVKFELIAAVRYVGL